MYKCLSYRIFESNKNQIIVRFHRYLIARFTHYDRSFVATVPKSILNRSTGHSKHIFYINILMGYFSSPKSTNLFSLTVISNGTSLSLRCHLGFIKRT